MRIASIELGIVRVPLITPFKTALRTVEQVEDVVIRITDAEGMVGFGEAPPTKAITGETLESIQETVCRRIVPALRLLPEEAGLQAILDCIQGSCGGSTSAKAAADIAVHDLAAREAGLPLHQFLRRTYGNGYGESGIGGVGGTGGTGGIAGASVSGHCARETISPAETLHTSDVPGTAPVLRTDLTISVNPIPQMQDDARIAVQRGFSSVKIKVGKEGEQDLQRIRAIRDAVGEEIAILVDANQGWTPEEALHILHRAEEMGLRLTLVEQPVRAADLEGMAAVTAGTGYPIAADESCFHPEDARRIFERKAADLVNIKLMKCGGLREAQRIAEYARGAGKYCMMGCMLESGIAVGAAAHFAAAQGGLVSVTDLDGPMLCAENPYVGGPVYDGPTITLNETPGLGIERILPDYLKEWSSIG